MDLNSSPPLKDDEEFFKNHLEEDGALQDIKETSVQILRREREERRERLRRNLINNRPVLTEPSVCDEGPYSKKLKYDSHRLPPGWLDCPNFGHEIGFLIPSKVPLNESFNDYIVDKKRYSFRNVLRLLGHELGMVVDLTNTDRYYQMTEVRGLKYLKIRCQGRHAIPDNESVNKFVFVVAQFIYNQSERQPRKYVSVHCTHGHNRTGYMIVHYLMRTQQASSVTEAIQTFAKSRPPGIYKEDYINALYDFYHETKPDLAVCPSTPEWKRSADVFQNSGALPDDDDGVSNASIMGKHENNVRMTNDDVLGDKLPDQQEFHLRRFCYDMLKPPGANSQFPGSHPVSLDRVKLQLLRQRYYYATWKADGTRYMMLLSPDGCYLIDRRFKFRRMQMRLPCRSRTKSEFHQYTLLDGEMIIDSVSPQKQERRYLIYDLIALNGVSLIERPFSERWMMIEKEIIEPRNQDRKQMLESHSKPSYRYDLEPFRVRRKDFWLLSTVRKLLNEFIPNLSHEADGLIFQGWDDPYIPKTHEGLLKWKFPEMNSVDFLFEIGEFGSEDLYLYDKGKKRLMEGNRVTFSNGSDSSSYSGKIIECSWDIRQNVWVYMRTRTDKLTPNEFSTYKKVMRSIHDNITQDVLLNEIGEIIRLPMYANRIKNDTIAQKKAKVRPQGKI
ncbi:mRNA-capping enzyme-like [Chenopodium quinoa]|uniref:mRNA-capping enzyme-like n=1 Tax=Chenopodium quinoa TaxID=63459 RepID=UPI000B777771|nr:mRNA-capping enzyme-like [Chenopodium quinoa]XP_021774797.1 mRNA-capping enzyme-like [Chenopodium quinoa]